MKIPSLKLLPCIALSVTALAVQQARADMVTYDLTTDNISVSGDTEPFVSVQVNLTSTTSATITFNALSSGSDINLLGSVGAVAVNVNATSWTLGSFSGVNTLSGFTPGPLSDGGIGHEDGYGDFNQSLDSFDSYTHSYTQITFTITDNSGTWGSASGVLIGNKDGNIAAANIIVAEELPGGGANNLNDTGFASDAVQVNGQVPDGGTTAIMLAAVLLGLVKGRTLFARQ